MATFETQRRLRDTLGDEPAEAVAQYVEDSQGELTTRADFAALRADFAALRSDLDVLRAELRGDMYRALWIQAGFVVTVNAGVVTAIVAIATAFG